MMNTLLCRFCCCVAMLFVGSCVLSGQCVEAHTAHTQSSGHREKQSVALAALPDLLGAPHYTEHILEQQSLHDALHQLNTSRIAMNKTAMLTLGGWALGNILINGLLMFRSEGEPFAFQQMNTLWNVVNLGLAGLGYWGSLTETDAVVSTYTLAQTIEKQHTLESILLFNAGLDVAYMVGGAWMLDHARTTVNPAQWRGWGHSLLLQGAFLLLFDVTVYWLQHSTHEPMLSSVLTMVSVHAHPLGGVQMGLRLPFDALGSLHLR